MACTKPCNCCKGACCNGGLCTQETCEDCENAGGTYKGPRTKCADYDCSGFECVEKTCTSSHDSDPYYECEAGSIIPAGTCAVPAGVSRSPSIPNCEFGTSPPTTIALSGVVPLSGDPVFDSLLDATFNNSYTITRDCCSGGYSGAVSPCGIDVVFPAADSDYEVRVNFPLSPSAVTIALYEKPNTLSAFATVMPNPVGPVTGVCDGGNVSQCGEPFVTAGIATSIANIDLSGATATYT